MQTVTPARPPRRSQPRRRRRRSRRPPPVRERQPPPSLGAELRLWLGLADRALSSLERIAWDARSVARSAGELVQGARQVQARGERLRHTGFMLARVAAGYRLYGLRAAFLSERAAERLLQRLHESSARSFRDVSAEQGGAFLKVGQLLSARADLLPRVWIDELAELQDAAPALPADQIEAAIEAALGAAPDGLFAEFEREPIAAASIGQVHRARTHDGRTVAVKVQRPGVGALVEADLGVLELFVESMGAVLPDMDHATIVAEVRAAVLAELDYLAEARIGERVADAVAELPGVVVPRPVAELCAPTVLTTDFVEGQKITHVLDALHARAEAGDGAARAELSELLGRLLSLYLRQVLQHGLFQADPHPGNLLVTPAGELVLLDFGCSQALQPEVRAGYLQTLRALLAGDRACAAELLLSLGFRTRSGAPDTLLAFCDALLGEIVQSAAGPVRWPERGELLQRAAGLAEALRCDPVTTLPPHFVMLGRVFGTLGGLFSHYRPELDFMRHVLPVVATALEHSGNLSEHDDHALRCSVERLER